MKMTSISLYFKRLFAISIKEFRQLKRDKTTFGMIIGVPIVQLVLFSTVINTDPKNLPILVKAPSNSIVANSIISGLELSGYFKILSTEASLNQIEEAFLRGAIKLAISFEDDFESKLIRGLKPDLLIEADATDPLAISASLANVKQIIDFKLNQINYAPLNSYKTKELYELKVHSVFNPEKENNYNTVPGLVGVILTLTLMMMTSMAIVREKERGNIELLLSTPITGMQIMLGKIFLYVFIGIIQVLLILLIAVFVFGIPFVGSLLWLSVCVLAFIATNLALGLCISSISQNQLQAVQLSIFIFLPSLLLSGFMFPFDGMPKWAQIISEILPLTHFLRLIRAIILKGTEIKFIYVDLVWLLGLFALLLLGATLNFKKTLD